ncbi:MAG: hypothetical protein HQM10_16525 [Candidatus Riflebacteria bacterium]|nr:hypothetical protein [Candidatus Riflebacteria bacterium]
MKKIQVYSLFIAFILFPLTLYADDLLSLIEKQSKNDYSTYYKPVAEWSGGLILPEKNDREKDGSVWIEIHNTPVKGLRGKILRLRWDFSKPENAWFNEIRPDVNIDPKRLDKAKKAKMILPERVNGWTKVSPLESLAGSHPVDDLEVILKEPKFSENSLYISQECSQTKGIEKALVRFSGPSQNGYRLVEHFSNGNFSRDITEYVILPPTQKNPSDGQILTTTDKIERSELNRYGWYVYGRRIRGIFRVESIEPRRLFTAKSIFDVSGAESCSEWLTDSNYQNLYTGEFRITSVDPRGKEKQKGPGNESDSENWKVGKKYLLMHLFGWRKKPGQVVAPGAMFGLVTGHFSFGTAEVILDEFTGEKRFDIEYHQVYAHSSGGIISGTHKWNSYMGSLFNGWSNTVPVFDTIIDIPELETYSPAGITIHPLKGLQRELEKMQAVYRTGAGTGISEVRPDVSCVQDSHAALYSALTSFEQTVIRHPELRKWLFSANSSDPDIRRFIRLKNLVKQIENMLSFLGIVRCDWKNNYADPLGVRDPSFAEKIIRPLLSSGNVFPRSATDRLYKLAIKNGYPMWTLLSVQIGGEITGFVPLAPTSLTK